MRKFKPINILDNKGFWPEKAALADALKEILILGACARPMPVRDYGRYKGPEARDENNNLIPWQSVDWYVYDALDEERMQVDSSRILHDLSTEPWREEKMLGDHYDLLVIEEDMFDPATSGDGAEVGYSVGRCKPFTAAVISTHRIEHIWGIPYSYIKTEVMRQLCFVFGLPDASRDDVIMLQGGAFCQNACILRPARVAPEDWETLTADRLKHGALCKGCTFDLKKFFASAEEEKN